MIKTVSFTISLILVLGAAGAEVIDLSPHGFTSKNSVNVHAPADEVFRHLVEGVGRWWDPDHTFSGDSTNLFIEARPGGCFCEKLGDNGGVQHLEVVYVEPARQLRMRGGLGPLQAMGVIGGLTWALEETDGTTEVTVTYAVGGYYSEGLDKLATPVDNVVSGQLLRLERFIEEGSTRGPQER